MWYLERKARDEFDLKRNNIDEDKKRVIVRWTEEKDRNIDI